MSRIEHSQRLRPHRRALVTAAEGIIEQTFDNGGGRLPAKSQFSRLVNVCGEASCAEEIANYLRYQAGRDAKGLWSVEFVKLVTKGIEEVLVALDALDLDDAKRDATRVEAWRLYATYLTRSFTYHDAVQKDRRRGGGG